MSAVCLKKSLRINEFILRAFWLFSQKWWNPGSQQDVVENDIRICWNMFGGCKECDIEQPQWRMSYQLIFRLYIDFIITGGDDLLQLPNTTTTTACTS